MSNASATSERLQLQQLRLAKSGKFLDNNVWNVLLSYIKQYENPRTRNICWKGQGNVTTMHFFCKYGDSEILAKILEFMKETQYRYLENVRKFVGRIFKTDRD